MIRHYNFMINGYLIEVTAASFAEARDKAMEEYYQLKTSRENGD